MEIVLSAIALMILLMGGIGTLLLLSSRHRPIDLLEFLGLGFLCGCTLVSLSSFIIGFFFSGAVLRSVVTLLCLAVLFAGLRNARRNEIVITKLVPSGLRDWLLIGLILAQFGFLSWFSIHTGLGWDGVFHWEIKARLAFENHGVLPLGYLTDKSLWSSHRGYPLLMPLTEAWFYGWMGVAHQGIIKLLFPLFFLASLGLLATAWGKRSILAPLLLSFVPLVQFGDGSVSAGYADFPLAAYYLAAVVYLLRFLEKPDTRTLGVFAVMCLSLPWLKQEGNVLFFVLAVLFGILLVLTRLSWRDRLRTFGIGILPGLVVLAGWSLFIRVFKAPVEQYYLPLTPAILMENLSRLPQILEWLKREFLNWNHWGVFWVVLPIGLVRAWLTGPRQRTIVAGLAIGAPLLIYSVIYLFVATDRISLSDWLLTSLSRLMLHVVPVGALVIAWPAKPAVPQETVGAQLPIMP